MTNDEGDSFCYFYLLYVEIWGIFVVAQWWRGFRLMMLLLDRMCESHHRLWLVCFGRLTYFAILCIIWKFILSLRVLYWMVIAFISSWMLTTLMIRLGGVNYGDIQWTLIWICILVSHSKTCITKVLNRKPNCFQKLSWLVNILPIYKPYKKLHWHLLNILKFCLHIVISIPSFQYAWVKWISSKETFVYVINISPFSTCFSHENSCKCFYLWLLTSQAYMLGMKSVWNSKNLDQMSFIYSTN